MTLDEFLKNSPLTEAAFGELIGCSQGQVNRLRKGGSQPSPERIARIRDATKGKVNFNDFYPLASKRESAA